MKRCKRILLCTSILLLAGCGDTPHSIYRRVLSAKFELLDDLMKVVDEDTAKKFDKDTVGKFKNLVSAENEKLVKIVQEIERKLPRWGKNEPAKTKEDAVKSAKQELLDIFDDLLDAKIEYIRQEVGNAGRIDHEIERLGKVIAKREEKDLPNTVLRKLADQSYYTKLGLESVRFSEDEVKDLTETLKELRRKLKYEEPPRKK